MPVQETQIDPWSGRPHMPWGNKSHTPQLLELKRSKVCAPQQGRPLQWEAHVPQLESSPHLLQLEKGPYSDKDPAQPNKYIIFKSS